jgi:hypothetical protein
MISRGKYCDRDECYCRLCIERARLREIERKQRIEQAIDKYILDHHHPSWYVNGLCCCDYCSTGRRAIDTVAVSELSVSDINVTTIADEEAAAIDRNEIRLLRDEYIAKLGWE